jgi:molybdate transport system permease protein
MEFNASPIRVSIETSVAATAITFFLGLAAANWRTKSPGRKGALMDALFIVPLVLPPTVVGYLLLLALGRTSPLGREIQDLGFSILFTWPATVIAAAVVAFPLMYLTARGALEQVNPSYLQAARTLGAAEWTVFWRVTLPLAWPGVLAGAVLSFSRALGEFGATLMIAGNIPGRTQTLPIAIFFAAEAGDMRQALAWVLVTLGVASIAIVAFNTWGRRMAASAMAGRKA